MTLVILKQWYTEFKATVFGASPFLLPYYILGFGMILNIVVMWPGQMSPDSYTQYKAAITGVFDDHHPPMMSLLWGFFDRVYAGPGLLFLFHLSMLYSACVLFIAAAQSRFIRIWYAVFPFVPPILFYSSMVWKDVGFAFSFLCAVAIVHYYIQQQKKISALAIGAILSLIFYGMAVKFQGKYVAPLVLWGLWYCIDAYRLTYKTVIKTILSTGLVLTLLTSFNDFFVPATRKAHSWQCVKLYDLAAMSVYAQQPLFPAFIQADPEFSFQAVCARCNHQRVDDLFMPPHNPLRLGRTEHERTALLHYWQQAVLQHPLLYLRHRFMNWWAMVNNMPLKHLDTMDFSQFGGMQWFVDLRNATHQKPAALGQYIFNGSGQLLYWFLYVVRYFFKFVFLLPFIFFYFVFGCVLFYRRSRGMSLIIMNGISIWFLAIVFVCSMASDMRYVYIAACMTHASHAIAIELWRNRKKECSNESRAA